MIEKSIESAQKDKDCQADLMDTLYAVACCLNDKALEYLKERNAEFKDSSRPSSQYKIKYKRWAVNLNQKENTFNALEEAVSCISKIVEQFVRIEAAVEPTNSSSAAQVRAKDFSQKYFRSRNCYLWYILFCLDRVLSANTLALRLDPSF